MQPRSPTPALLALSLGYFTFGTSSLAVVGLSAPISSGLHVPAAQVGLLVSVFALTFAVAAPLAPVVLARVPRKRALLLGLGVMAIGGLLAAIAPSYGFLCGARVIGALGGAVFGPASSAAGSLIVPEERRPQALATVFGGMTAAAVLGVPLSSFLGNSLGWRWALTGVAVLTVLALVLVALLLPEVEAGERPTARAYRLVLGTPGTVPTVLTTLFFMAAQFTVYGVAGAYIAARFGSPPSTVALVLLAFGVVGVIGNASGARTYERFGGRATITTTQVGLGAAFLALALVPHALPAALAVFAFWAFFSQLYQAPQQARLVALLPDQRGIVLALNASALNIGVSLGSLLGSTALPWAGARLLSAIGLVPLALAVVAHAVSVRRIRTAEPDPAPDPAQGAGQPADGTATALRTS